MACQASLGRFWQGETAPGRVLETTLDGGPLLVASAQLDKMGGRPRLPFTVVAVDAREVRPA